MIMSPDGKSLRRGRRGALRHPIERAAHIWRVGEEDTPAAAVATDISTIGVGLQTRSHFTLDDEVMVDIKRGKEILGETFIYLRGRIVRVQRLSKDRLGVGIMILNLERKGF